MCGDVCVPLIVKISPWKLHCVQCQSPSSSSWVVWAKTMRERRESSEDRNIFKTGVRPGKMGERKERK